MNAEEFKKRFLPLSRRLYTVAWRLTGNRQDAEDIVQECYIKLWNKRNSLEHIVNIEAYAVTLTKRLCYDSFKTSQRGYVTEINDKQAAVIDNTTDYKEELMQVHKFIDKLPDQQKNVIVMREIEDCPYDEIERRTGLTSVNIRVLLSRARKKLRQQFKDLLDDEQR